MLSIKNTLIAGALAFAVCFLTGYSARDNQAESKMFLELDGVAMSGTECCLKSKALDEVK